MKNTDEKIKIDIVIPVYNEEKVLENNVKKLFKHLQQKKFTGYLIKIVIADNASNDSTSEIAKSLTKSLENIEYQRLEKKGRGRALKHCWKISKANVLTYIDADLSADLSYLKKLLDAIILSGYDLAIGSRLRKDSQVKGRTIMREIMSRGYNFLIKIFFGSKIMDAQCGFKAITNDAFRKLLRKIKNNNWFFDSEMLIIAEKMGMKIFELPIKWSDDPSSTVKVASTAVEDLLGLWRLKITKPWKD